MANKARIYQAQGNLQEAARFLSEINGRLLLAFLRIKIDQLEYERNYGELIRLLQARVTQDGSDWWIELNLAYLPVAGWGYGWRKGYR